jgi:hypothetical protein
MALEKLRISNLDLKDDIDVLFNPSEYTFEDANVWEEQKHTGQKSGTQFTGRGLKKLSLELFFDTYEAGTDVREATNRIAALLVPLDQKPRPPRCGIVWGQSKELAKDSRLEWVLESLKQQFTLFRADGTPVRARLTVTFKEYVEPEKEEKSNPKRNSFPAKTYTMHAGETLAGIAGTLWGRPGDWRLLANANNIDNPLRLQAGRVLTVPAVP